MCFLIWFLFPVQKIFRVSFILHEISQLYLQPFSHRTFQFVLSMNLKLLNFLERDHFVTLSTHLGSLYSTTALLLFFVCICLLNTFWRVFFILYCTQSHIDLGSSRSFFPSIIHVGIKEFICSTYSLSLSKEQLNFQIPGLLA